MPSVTFDQRCVRVGGRATPILCGAVHYPRSTPGLWPEILRASVEAGINTIDTYVFWGLHEREKRKYDFSGRLDLPLFLRLCQQHGLNVILRIGPYICAETNFGGLPPWLIHEPGLVTRTHNDAWKREVLTWCKTLLAQIGEFQATRGGPIILAQLENEYNTVAKHYGEDGPKYMDWVIASAAELGLDVPLVMCEAPGEHKLALNDAAMPLIIKGLNGFAVADRVPEFQRQFTAAPPLWTETWSAWYSNWGDVRHYRGPAELAFAVTHFFAAGGAGISYYMWHGGTNFGRDAVYLHTTSYDFCAPLDEFGIPQRAYAHLAKLNRVFAQHAELLLEGSRSVQVLQPAMENEPLPRAAIYRCEKGGQALLFLINNSAQDQHFGAASLHVTLKPRSAALALDVNGDSRLLFETHPAQIDIPPVANWTPSLMELNFERFDEPLPDGDTSAVTLEQPSSMLPYTRDLTDYAWYQTVLNSPSKREASLTLPEVHDFSTLFVNGTCVGSQPERLNEDPKIFARHEYSVRLNQGENQISILAAAMGLIKGDWAYNEPMCREKKGLIGNILLDGAPQQLHWTLQPGLKGERARIFAPGSSELAAWQPLDSTPRPLCWYRAKFSAPASGARAFALELGGLFKGLIWLNGECVARYWQLAASDGVQNWMRGMTTTFGLGEPAQTRYHIPRDWLLPENTLVIFEETARAPRGVRLIERS